MDDFPFLAVAHIDAYILHTCIHDAKGSAHCTAGHARASEPLAPAPTIHACTHTSARTTNHAALTNVLPALPLPAALRMDARLREMEAARLGMRTRGPLASPPPPPPPVTVLPWVASRPSSSSSSPPRPAAMERERRERDCRGVCVCVRVCVRVRTCVCERKKRKDYALWGVD